MIATQHARPKGVTKPRREARDDRERAPFAPTEAMKRYAEACCAGETPATDEARCAAAQIGPQALARWRSDPAFASWLRAEVVRLLTDRTWEVWTVLGRLAREGNLPAAKLFLERFDPSGAALAGAAPETFRELARLALEEPARDTCAQSE